MLIMIIVVVIVAVVIVAAAVGLIINFCYIFLFADRENQSMLIT